MRVSVYKNEDGTMSMLVEAAVGRGLSPVLLNGVTRENLRDGLAPVIAGMRWPDVVQAPLT